MIHKLIEARYRHHVQLAEAARRHSGLPPTPVLRPPPGARNIDPAVEQLSGEHGEVHPGAELTQGYDDAVTSEPPPTGSDE